MPGLASPRLRRASRRTVAVSKGRSPVEARASCPPRLCASLQRVRDATVTTVEAKSRLMVTMRPNFEQEVLALAESPADGMQGCLRSPLSPRRAPRHATAARCPSRSQPRPCLRGAGPTRRRRQACHHQGTCGVACASTRQSATQPPCASRAIRQGRVSRAGRGTSGHQGSRSATVRGVAKAARR